MDIQCDYLVIGTGSAGAVVASRLSADPANAVVALEAGPSDKSKACSTTALTPCITRWAPAGWAATKRAWWIRSCGSGESTDFGSPTPR